MRNGTQISKEDLSMRKIFVLIYLACLAGFAHWMYEMGRLEHGVVYLLTPLAIIGDLAYFLSYARPQMDGEKVGVLFGLSMVSKGILICFDPKLFGSYTLIAGLLMMLTMFLSDVLTMRTSVRDLHEPDEPPRHRSPTTEKTTSSEPSECFVEWEEQPLIEREEDETDLTPLYMRNSYFLAHKIYHSSLPVDPDWRRRNVKWQDLLNFLITFTGDPLSVELDEEMVATLREFQSFCQLRPSGIPDRPTVDAAHRVQRHGNTLEEINHRLPGLAMIRPLHPPKREIDFHRKELSG